MLGGLRLGAGGFEGEFEREFRWAVGSGFLKGWVFWSVTVDTCHQWVKIADRR